MKFPSSLAALAVAGGLMVGLATAGRPSNPFFALSNGTSPDVTVTNREGWIQTLDRGTFDVAGFLRTLREVGFTGPVGLQSWSIKGDAWDNLRRSMAAWQKMQN
jgi:hypothetical protein